MQLSDAISLQWPKHQTEVFSWQGHIPFAFWLMTQTQPHLFVELGTHKGDSYMAFCQVILQLKLSTKCIAVDSWEGDEHAGYYGDEVYNNLKKQHDPLYSGFSELWRMRFDKALEKIEDKSVDLLHIDGLHTYEAVKHDFETWLPKMSKSGVVLFHDTAVKEKDFGVWRLWEELEKKYPHFLFKHSFGLGVLCVGKNIPEPLKQLTELPEHRKEEVRYYYARLGNGIIDNTRFRLVDHHRTLLLQEREKQLAEIKQYQLEVAQQREELHRHIEGLGETLRAREEYLQLKEQELEDIYHSPIWKFVRFADKCQRYLMIHSRRIWNDLQARYQEHQRNKPAITHNPAPTETKDH